MGNICGSDNSKLVTQESRKEANLSERAKQITLKLNKERLLGNLTQGKEFLFFINMTIGTVEQVKVSDRIG